MNTILLVFCRFPLFSIAALCYIALTLTGLMGNPTQKEFFKSDQ